METARPSGFVEDRSSRAAGASGVGRLVDALPQAVLSDITHLLVSEDSPDRILAAVADGLSELVPHDSLTLYGAEPPLRRLRPVLVRDPQYEEEIRALGTIPYGRGISGITAETRVPQLANDVHMDPRAITVPNTPNDPESLIAIPLLARDDLKGVLCLHRLGENQHFTVQEFKLAIVFSELAALAIDNGEIRRRLEAEVITDHLTALYNHRYFHERLAEEVRRANRQHGSVSLIVYDIDDFKRVNDTYGHLAGDQVLQGVASVTRETCRMEDVICRIGGEEFAVILPGTPLSEAALLAERLREGIPRVAMPGIGQITVSAGVAVGPLHASSPRELMACADMALLDAKGAGKDQIRVFQAEQQLALEVSPGPGSSKGEDSGNGHGHGTQARLASMSARGEIRSAAELRVLQNLSAKLSRLTDVGEIGDTITAELRSLIDYHNCRVYLLQSDGQTLVPIAFRGSLSEYQGETFDALLTRVGEGLTGLVAERGESYYTPNANDDPHAVLIPGTPELDESILGVPMKYGDRMVGVLVLSKLGIDQFDQEDTRLLEALAAGAAVAFENARLLQAEHQAVVELERAYVSTVESLANALEAKDDYTVDHCRALAEMALAVGTEMGLVGERLRHLELGALFHDIGKIGVPSDVIRKPGPLTAGERRTMNLHPEIGERILAPVPFLQPVRPIVRSSHERWDGNGYPDGLAGEAIPLESRIVFVCDAFHAMTTNRPYRAALSTGEAVRRLRLSSGTQFDRDVVEVFVRLLRQGRITFGHGAEELASVR
jgi:diguanylate cyclase (GGDEF)-like protein